MISRACGNPAPCPTAVPTHEGDQDVVMLGIIHTCTALR